MKEVKYGCDICGEKMSRAEAVTKMMGVRFTYGTKFTLDDTNKTDGKHICISCLKQLKEGIDANWNAINAEDEKPPTP